MADVLGLARTHGKVDLTNVLAVLGVDCDAILIIENEIEIFIVGIYALLSKSV